LGQEIGDFLSEVLVAIRIGDERRSRVEKHLESRFSRTQRTESLVFDSFEDRGKGNSELSKRIRRNFVLVGNQGRS